MELIKDVTEITTDNIETIWEVNIFRIIKYTACWTILFFIWVIFFFNENFFNLRSH